MIAGADLGFPSSTAKESGYMPNNGCTTNNFFRTGWHKTAKTELF